MLRSQETLDTNALYGIQYDWLSSQDTRDKAIAGWEELIGEKITVLPIDGHHFEAFAPENVSGVCPQLFDLGN